MHARDVKPMRARSQVKPLGVGLDLDNKHTRSNSLTKRTWLMQHWGETDCRHASTHTHAHTHTHMRTHTHTHTCTHTRTRAQGVH